MTGDCKRVAKAGPLKVGDWVAIVAPGACLTDEGREYLGEAVSLLESWGYRVKAIPDPNRRSRYFAGEDQERAEQLMFFFSDPEVRALLCARGGYGSQRIIPFLDSEAVHRNPKILVGSSDITALLVYLLEACRVVPFHGPNVATREFLEAGASRTRQSLKEIMALGIPHETPSCRTLKGGIGRGKIKGGCLSLLVTTIGTSHEIDLRGAILFVEDTNEPPYRIDRMLTHMRQAGKLDQIEGVVFGKMPACEKQDGVDVESVVLDLFHDQEIPIIYGFPSGHGQPSLTIPLGVDVTLDGNQGRLIFNESGLSVP